MRLRSGPILMRTDDARKRAGISRDCLAIGAFMLLLCVLLTTSELLRRADFFFFDVVQPLSADDERAKLDWPGGEPGHRELAGEFLDGDCNL